MHTDFLIIGGGIAGVSAAARLSQHGKVTLLEAESNLAHHASGRSAALYEPRYGLAPVVELSLASGDFFRESANVLSPRGIMILGRPGEDAAFDHDIADMQLPEIPFEQARTLPQACQPCEFRDSCHGGCAGRRRLQGALVQPDSYCPIIRGQRPPLEIRMAANRDLPKLRSSCTTVVIAR